MPWRDWEFWIVTTLAVVGVIVLLRPFIPRRKGSDASCPNCATGSASAKPRRATLTIESKRPRA